MLDDRFWSKVEKTDTCWFWTASVIPGPRGGYGQFRIGKKMRKAHVLAYEDKHGPVPPGKQLDHTCRVRRCVNPAHLDPVTQTENQRRSPITMAGRKNCLNGHSLSTALIRPADGARICRVCRNEHARAARRARQLVNAA